ncbi:ATP-binding protein [bacterium]|nr:ATP-binding protein [bacterium]
MATFITVLASLFGTFAFFKYVLLIEMRVDANIYKTLYDLCKDDRKVMVYEELVSENRHPVAYVAFCFFKDSPWFFINHSERLMQAGFNEKDHITTITCFRWRHKRLKDFIRLKIAEMQLCTLGVPVQLMLPYGTDKIGSLKENFDEPVVRRELWEDFEEEVREVSEEKRKKTSALLYGPPGNGKTHLIKYLATKHRLPIMIFTLSPDWTNHDLLLIFSQIPKRCVVLFEDFDNYFDGRSCILGGDNKNIKFTFDIILNGLDGVYTTHENVVFIMTVNDIGKVDDALKSRPSRFKFVREFGNPDAETRMKILGAEMAGESEGMSLDQIFRVAEARH